MSEWDLVPKFKPAAPPPILGDRSARAQLYKPYAACWIASDDLPRVLSFHHTRKTAERSCRDSLHDTSSPEVNHHTRFYIWDSSLPWNPDSLHSWTPIAERPRDQWVLSL